MNITLPVFIWIIAITLFFADMFLTYKFMKKLQQKKVKDWWTYEMNMFGRVLMKKFGTKGIFYSLPITLTVLLGILRGVHIGILPTSMLWFFSGVYFIIFQLHYDNLKDAK